MTKLQRLLLILLIIVGILQLFSVIGYVLDDRRGFPTFLPGLVLLPLFGGALWQDIQRTHRGEGRSPVLEQRIIQNLIMIMVVVVIVPLGLALFVRTLVAWNVGIGLSVFSALIMLLFVMTYIVYIRRTP